MSFIRATLLRTETGDQGTFGELTLDTGLTLVTGELPWRGNRPGQSCIPVGEYIATMEWSPRFCRQFYKLRAVPERGNILIHPGNFCGDVALGFKSDVEGCILLGSHTGTAPTGQKIVSMSRWAVDALHANTQGRDLLLDIREDFDA